MKNIKSIFLLTTVLMLLFTISAISATDIDNDANIIDDAAISSQYDNTITNDISTTQDTNTDTKTNKNIIKNNLETKENVKGASRIHIVNDDNVDKIFNGTNYTLSDSINDGDILDFQGTIDKEHQLIVNKPVNIISTTEDAVISLHSGAGDANGNPPPNSFIFTIDVSGSTIRGLYFDNTECFIHNVYNAVFKNMTMHVKGAPVGKGIGQTSLRYCNNVTMDSCYIYTEDNGGSSSFVWTGCNNCTIINSTIQGVGNVGNILYVGNQWNTADKPANYIITNFDNNIINCTVRGGTGGICNPLQNGGIRTLIQGNKFYSGGAVSIGTNGTLIDNEFYKTNVALTVSLTANAVAHGNVFYDTGTATVQANAQVYNNTFNAVTISGAKPVFENNIVNGKLTISQVSDIKYNNLTDVEVKTNGKTSNITNNNATGTITSAVANVTIDSNNIITPNEYAVVITGADNVVTNNYLVAYDKTGNKAVSTTQATTIIENNIPLPEIITLNDGNWTEYFDDDGTVKSIVIPCSELRFEGVFNNREMVITIPLNLTTAEQQAVLNNCTITVEYDDVNITNIQMNANDVEGSLIYVEDASNVRIEGNALSLNNNGEKVVTHTIEAYGSPNMIIRNNTITTVGPEENIVYDSKDQISLVYTNSINVELSNGTIIDNNTITTKSNGKKDSRGTIYGVYVTGKYVYDDEKYVGDVQIINNVIYTKSDVYTYGIDLGHADGAIVYNNTVTTIGGNYSDGIQGFNVYNVAFINNSVTILAGDMGYGIIVNGFMHYFIDYDTYDFEVEVLAVEDNVVAGNEIFILAKDAWAIEVVIADDNVVEYNNITLVVSNGIGIGFADSENGLAQYNNISIMAAQTSGPNNGDALNSYTTGIKICQSLSQIKAATDNTVVFNNITVTAPNKDVYALNVSSNDNEITDNYLLTKLYAGDNAVIDTCDSNTVENNIPLPEIITLNDGNWTEYFDDDGTVKSIVIPCSELRFEGEFSDRFMIIDVPLNLTTAEAQGVLNGGSILVTVDNVNITKLVMNSEDTGETLITVEDSCNVNIEGNNLTITTTEDLVVTRAIIIDGGSDNVIRNNTITTIGPEDPIVYGADSSINALYTSSIEASSDRLVIDSNVITTKKNDVEPGDLGTIFGIYIHGSVENYLDAPQIINNEFFTGGKMYDYGIKVHFANGSLIENNTVYTLSEKYSSGIHVFVLNNSVINNNVVNSIATNMSYGIVTEGAMDLISYEVLGTENTQVINNVVNAWAKYVWAVEAYAGENNDISYNNVTVNADNGVAIALADQESVVSYNNIKVYADMESDISGSFDYIDPYTTGIKISNNGLKDANDNIVEFNNVTVTTHDKDVYAVNSTTKRNNITDNHLLTTTTFGDNAVIDTGTGGTVENNKPDLIITDETYSDYFDEYGTLKELFNNSALIVSGDFRDNTVFIFDNVNVTLTNDGTAVFYDGQIWTGPGATVTFDGLVFNNTQDAFILESSGNTIKNTVINIDSDDEIHAIYVYDDNNTISNTTINIVAPSANVIYNPDYSVNTPAPAAIVISSSNNVIEDVEIYFDGREAIHLDDPTAWDAPTVDGIYLVSSTTPIENNTITDTSIEVLGCSYAYGINVGNAKNTNIKDIYVDVECDFYADAIQLFDADTISITGKANAASEGIAYGVYSTAMGTGFSKNIDLTGLDINVVSAQATGVLIEGSSNITIADAEYEIVGAETTAINAKKDFMQNIPSNIIIDNMDISLTGTEDNNVLYFEEADTVSITNSNIESARGSEIVFNETPNSQVVNNYIKINDAIFGNYAVITTEDDTVIENNTPKSQKMEEMQQTIDELQKEIDELKAAKNTTLTLDEITDAKYNGNVTISGALINDDSIGLFNQVVTLTIGETEVNVTTKGGLFEYTTLFKELGEKTVTAYYAGTDKYLESEASITFTVEKQDLLITVDQIADTAYGDNVTITGKFTQADGRAVSNSNVNIYINDKQFKARTDKTGTFTLTTTVKATGTNNVTLSYGGNDKYNKFETSTTFNADKQDLIITYDAIADVKYNDNVTITGKFTDANGKAISNSNVNVYINGKQYKARTDKTGAFTLSVQTKTIGTNNVTLSYGGNDKYNSFETSTTFNVGAQDIVITYDPIAETVCGDNVTITGKFTEINGKAISKSNVNVYINGKQYKAKTDSTGAFTLSVATKVVGTNNVTFSYGGNAYYSSYETSTTFNVIAKAE